MKKNAATFKVITQQDDTTFTEQYYQNYGAMLWLKTYKDKNLTLLHGFSNWYNSDGDCDTAIHYANGNIVYTEHLSIVSFEDGHSEKMLVPVIHDTDTAERFSTIQIEAKFPDGGEKGWINYIGKHLNTSIGKLIPKYKNIQDKRAVVKISFLVNKNGEITEVNVLHSSSYPFDSEAMQVIGLPNKGRGAVGEVVFLYPNFPLRIYALRINNRADLVVLFNGGVKSAQTNQNSGDLYFKWLEACRFARRIDEAIREREIIIDTKNRLILSAYNDDEIVL